MHRTQQRKGQTHNRGGWGHEFLTAHSRSLTLDHQQPWDIMHVGVETFLPWIGKLHPTITNYTGKKVSVNLL